MTLTFTNDAVRALVLIRQLDLGAHDAVVHMAANCDVSRIDERVVWLLYMKCATGQSLDLEIQARLQTFLFATDVIDHLSLIAEIDRDLVIQIVNWALATGEPSLNMKLLNEILDQMHEVSMSST